MCKKTYFHFLLILFIATIWSCTKENEPLAIQTIEPLSDTVYIKGQTPSEIIFPLKAKNGEGNNIEAITFYKIIERRFPYFQGTFSPNDSIGRSSKTFLKKATQIPSDLTISISDLIRDTQYNNPDELPLLTSWSIYWEVKLKDGQIIPSPDSLKIQYQCLSNLEGNYKATHDDCTMNAVNVTIGKLYDQYYRDYKISDLSAGQFNCMGQSEKLEFSFREECGIILPASQRLFGYIFSILEGSKWNEATNTLTIIWYNSVQNKVITSTFVRQ